MVKTLEWIGDALRLIDQTRLPNEVVYIDCRDVETVARAIEVLSVRGAPAIGVAAAYGTVIGAIEAQRESGGVERIKMAIERLEKTRPTARNLFWALERMKNVLKRVEQEDVRTVRDALLNEANSIYIEDREICRKIGENGSRLLKDNNSVLTHCNAGALATAGAGTALSVIYTAVEQGKTIRVFADETRPLLQGARLTAWELMESGVDVTLICDSMVGSVMKSKMVDCVVVGADRIASNGDVANKIGTYSVAVLAKEHGIPFYVAAPLSTLDMDIECGDQIPIEERKPQEVTEGFGKRTAPFDVKVYSPAFDVTPNSYVSAIISEKGIARGNYNVVLRNWAKTEDSRPRPPIDSIGSSIGGRQGASPAV